MDCFGTLTVRSMQMYVLVELMHKLEEKSDGQKNVVISELPCGYGKTTLIGVMANLFRK